MILFAFYPHEALSEKIACVALLLMPVIFGIKYLRERWQEEQDNK
jgi:cadmium resistance protein CadD (predicted permease)